MPSSFDAYQRGGSVEFASRWDSTQRSGSMSRSTISTTASTSAIGRSYSSSTSNAYGYTSNLSRAGSSSLSNSLNKMPNKYASGNSSSSISSSMYDPKRSTFMSSSSGKTSTNRWSASSDRLNSSYSRLPTNNLMSTSFSSAASRFGLNSMNSSSYSGSSIQNRTNSFKSDLSKSLYEPSTSSSTTTSRYKYDSRTSSSGYSSSSNSSIGNNYTNRFKSSTTSSAYSTPSKHSSFTSKDDQIERTYERIRSRYATETSDLKSQPTQNGTNIFAKTDDSMTKSLTTHSGKVNDWSRRISTYSTNPSATIPTSYPTKNSEINSVPRTFQKSSYILSKTSIFEDKTSPSLPTIGHKSTEESGPTDSIKDFTFQPKIHVKATNHESVNVDRPQIEITQLKQVDTNTLCQIVENKTSATLILPLSTSQYPTQNDVNTPVLIVTESTAPSTPMSTTSNVVWTVQDVDAKNQEPQAKGADENEEYSTEGSYEDEEYSGESEWEESDEIEEEEYDTQLTIPLFTTEQNGLLHPNHALTQSNCSSISSSTEFDTEFDLILMVNTKDQAKDQRGRTSHTNNLKPPPIFTACVTYDGMADWDNAGDEDFDDEEQIEGEIFFPKDGNLQVLNPRKLSAYSSESEYDGSNIDVGCTLSLVDKAAMQDSGSEYTTDSEYEDESEYYEESEYSDEEIEETNDVKVTLETPPNIATWNEENSSEKPATLPASLIETQVEDKSSVRKAPENMSIEEQQKAEQKKKELANQVARSTGLVSSMRNQFRQPSPPKQEQITYKRSSRLEPKSLDEQRQRKTYEVVKPTINDEFDKQMAELRAQMEDKNTRLLSDYRNLSKGINSLSDDAKLRAKEEQHKELLDRSTTTFSEAEKERLRWQEQNMSIVERRHREEEHKRQLELKAIADAKAAAQIAAQAERKVTKRVLRKSSDTKQEAKVEPTSQPTERLNKKSATPEKKVLAPTENTLVPPTQISGERRKSIPSSRRKTMELMIRTTDSEHDENANLKPKKVRKRKHQVYRKNRFTRKPFDIDELLGFGAFKDFEELDDYFLSEPRVGMPNGKLDDQKRRRVDSQKVWISQLKDIDKLYKSSELRDIKLDGVS